MSKTLWPGGAMLAPVPPALVTCGTMERPNVLTIAWTGILNTQPPKTYISVRPERYSFPMIQETGTFVINLPTAAMVRAVDFCGVRSGRVVDKFKETGLTPVPALETGCPMLEEAPLALECRVCETVPLGSHTMFIADIVGVDVSESLIDDKGALHLERAGLLAYAHGQYFELGKRLGSFGFSVRKRHRHKATPSAKGRAKKK